MDNPSQSGPLSMVSNAKHKFRKLTLSASLALDSFRGTGFVALGRFVVGRSTRVSKDTRNMNRLQTRSYGNRICRDEAEYSHAHDDRAHCSSHT